MPRGWPWPVDRERGSALVAGLMLTLVITILGFALFDLAIRESRLVLGSEADYKAFETAQAALERTLHLLLLDLCGGSLACTDPDPTTSWADGSFQGVAAGPDAVQFYPLPLPNATACLQDPCGSDTTTYSVRLKNLTQPEALDLGDVGLLCTPVSSGDNTCRYLIYVRVTGEFARSGTTSARTIQVLAGAKKGPAFGGGILGGGSGGGTIAGNALIAGELQLVGCQPPPCAPVDLSGGAGVRNNYNDMPASLQARIPLLPLVTCPPGTLCSGTQVESLGVTVRVARVDVNPAINLSGSASLGTNLTTNNPVTGRPGKPSLDKVFIGDGCDQSNCADEVGGNKGAQNIFSDVPIKRNEFSCPPTCFPALTEKVTVNGIEYPNYAACPGPNSCTCPSGSGCAVEAPPPPPPQPPNDFFIAHAFKIVPGTLEDTGGCPTAPACTRDLHALLTTTPGLLDSTPNFTKTFVCGPQCNDANGNRVNGAIGVTTPAAFQLQWNQAAKLLQMNQCSGSDCTAVFSEPLPLPDPRQRVLPVLIYIDGPLKICEGCNNKTIYYQGQASFLAKGDISIDSSFLSCPGPACPAPLATGSDPDSFPRKSLLSFLTPANLNIGFTSNSDIMGVFYAGGRWETRKQTNIVGTVTAASFEMGNQVPKFFHVPQLTTVVATTVFRPTGAQWSLTTSKWQVCRNPSCS